MQIKSLLKITLVFTLCVIMMGAYTRLSDAGLGCPDWPGCYGMLKVPTESHELAKVQQAFPDHTVETEKAWLEMIHRYIAGALGLLVLLILILSLKTADAPKKLPMFIAALIIFQAALGMWTVTMKLMPIIVMAHLIGGFALFSLLLLLYLRNKPLRIPGGDPTARKLAGVAAISIGVLLLQIVLGGWTSANYAALACTTLPFCEGNWVDNLSLAKAFSPFQGDHASFEFGVLDYPARMTIHVAHRVGAIITAAILLYLAFKLIRNANSNIMRNAAWLLVGLVILQVALGISNVVLNLPLGIAVSHNAGAALLLLNLVFINYALWRKA
ncbi:MULTISPECIES: heme A synthase [unclassified Shewanella]|uniref:COX15/CtaA family protein n=1 Tax=unclassified Shewanella TaxID=196818 RepID=UPI001BC8168F|nr:MULTISPECIES: COX15/CtaA family protein [unclassified Shewanella]GIU21106.1 cytochrome b561 [Shewanella sp. MBTL60-112-B1]GIU40387.1 cytochrome b561 [Shewanella sp. MBTL60-112-B2]